MKTALILLLSFTAAVYAADPQQVKDPAANPKGQQPEEVKRLGAVTWDLDTHKLVWVVQKGAVVNGEFVPASEQKYEISPDEAVMAVAEEQRGFDGKEAVSLQHLLDVLSVYCAESVVWWEEGQGQPVNGGPPSLQDKPNAKPKSSDQPDKPVRVGQPGQPDKTPKYKVPSSDLVARAHDLW